LNFLPFRYLRHRLYLQFKQMHSLSLKARPRQSS
jgi:hypothetical protein